MNGFKLGDVITGNGREPYTITTQGTSNIVVSDFGNDRIIILNLSVSKLFIVEPYFFKPASLNIDGAYRKYPNLQNTCYDYTTHIHDFHIVGLEGHYSHHDRLIDTNNVCGYDLNLYDSNLSATDKEVEEEKMNIKYMEKIEGAYPWSEEETERIVDEVMSTVDKYELSSGVKYPLQRDAVHKMVMKSNRNKGWFEKILSNHKNYMPEIHGVMQKHSFHRGVDREKIYSYCGFIRERVNGYIIENEVKDIPWVMDRKGMEILDRQVENYRYICECMCNFSRPTNVTYMGEDYGYYANLNDTFSRKIAEAQNYIDRKNIRLYNGIYISQDTYKVIRNIYNFLDHLGNMSERITDRDADYINNTCGWYDFARAVKGQKTTKVVHKIWQHFGFDKYEHYTDETYVDPSTGECKIKKINRGYNHWRDIFNNAITELTKDFTVVITTNPVDILEMSNGTTWQSCMTLDKTGLYADNDSEHNYTGMQSGGCVDYAEDESTVILYLLDENYNDNTPWREGKIKRCLFYVGEDNFVQSRVYPDGRDGSDFPRMSEEMRGVFQNVVSECMEIDNEWDVHQKRGSNEIDSIIETSSSSYLFYRDYREYGDIYIGDTTKLNTFREHKKIMVGVPSPTCLCCGGTNKNKEAIVCNSCVSEAVRGNRDDSVQCECCGRIINLDTDSYVFADGYYFCDDECASNNGYEYCIDTEEYECNYYYDEYTGEYYSDNDSERIYVDDVGYFHGERSANYAGYYYCEDTCDWHDEDFTFVDPYDGLRYTADCDGLVETVDGYTYSCEDNALADGYILCDECGEYVSADDYDEDAHMCHNCAANREEEVA